MTRIDNRWHREVTKTDAIWRLSQDTISLECGVGDRPFYASCMDGDYAAGHEGTPATRTMILQVSPEQLGFTQSLAVS